MTIGVPLGAAEPGAVDALVLALAPVLVPVLALLLLLLLLLLLVQAARTPTESATAPSAAAFLENQGRVTLTPGSSFLIARDLRNRAYG